MLPVRGISFLTRQTFITCLVPYHASRPCRIRIIMDNNHQKTISYRQLILLDAIRLSERADNDGVELTDLAAIMGVDLSELSSDIADLQWLLDNGFIAFIGNSDKFLAQEH